MVIKGFWVISIFIDSDRGHSYKHLKKKIDLQRKLNAWHEFECLCAMNFWAARNGKKWSVGLFRPNLPQLGLFHPYFVCKSSFRIISMIKMVILDESKPARNEYYIWK